MSNIELILGYVFIAFFLAGFFAIFFSKKEYTINSFFNGGKNISWILLGFAILGTNIQIEYIIGSASKGYLLGLSYGSYEWTASFVLLIIGLYIIPIYMRVNAKTLPELIGVKYGNAIRIVFAFIFELINMAMLLLILKSSLFFLGDLFNVNKLYFLIALCLMSILVLMRGGFELKVKIDSYVIVGFLFFGLIFLILSVIEIGGIGNLIQQSSGRMRVLLPSTNKELPWTSVFLGSLWMNHFFYWAFFPPISHHMMSASKLSVVQKSMMFVASIKLLIPFILIIPGVIGYALYAQSIDINHVSALPFVMNKILPYSLFLITSLFYVLTILTTFNGFVHATATIFVFDIWQLLKKKVVNDQLIIYRYVLLLLVSFVFLLSFFLTNNEELFNYSHVILVSVSPIVTSIFLMSLILNRVNKTVVWFIIILGIPLYFIFKRYTSLSYLDSSGMVFLIFVSIQLLFNFLFPYKKQLIYPSNFNIKFERNLLVLIWAILIFTLVLSIYFVGGLV